MFGQEVILFSKREKYRFCFLHHYWFTRGDGIMMREGSVFKLTAALADGFRNEPDRKCAWLSHCYAYRL
ncbi:hypothetical protein SporoP33_00540 [Sporosarcina sp. P33]|nr:hypothetical protein SporoP33_00540 [Sporosarcina sp. P33]